MKQFSNLTFKQKLLWIILASSAAALVLGVMGFITADLLQFRRAMPRDHDRGIDGLRKRRRYGKKQGSEKQNYSSGHFLRHCFPPESGFYLRNSGGLTALCWLLVIVVVLLRAGGNIIAGLHRDR